MDILDTLLDRLEMLRPAGNNKWMARCPAHDDGSPSLSIHQAQDGTILAHCFAGCSADDVCAAVGLEIWQLFPDGKPGMTPRERELRKELDLLRVAIKVYKQLREDSKATAADHSEGREIIGRIKTIQESIDNERSSR